MLDSINGVPDAERFLDDRDLERLTPIKRVTYQVMRAQGIGPKYFRIGTRCVYKWSDVVEWIESGAAAKQHVSRPRRSAK